MNESKEIKKSSRIKTLINYLRVKLMNESTFPKWAIAKGNDLNPKRARTLGERYEVIWQMDKETGEASDHIEMSGFSSSAIISYGRDGDGKLLLNKHLVAPRLRLIPNLTASSYCVNFETGAKISVDGREILSENAVKAEIFGGLVIETLADKVIIKREYFPSNNYGMLIERLSVKNVSDKKIGIEISDGGYVKERNDTVSGKAFLSKILLTDNEGILRSDKRIEKVSESIAPSESYTVNVAYISYEEGENFIVDTNEEIDLRKKFIDGITGDISLYTDDKIIDGLFKHTMIRANESIFRTPRGLMHSPGGGTYYYAMWTNDECEYANPLFAYENYAPAREEAISCYKLYSEYMDMTDKPFTDKMPLVSSIISGGESYWNGAGDRGDAEMYAYGLSRFLLVNGDKKLAVEMMPYLKWCVDFTYSRLDKNGVIRSDRDELEGRFPSGKANLFTNSLAYDMLFNIATIARETGENSYADECMKKREELYNNILKYFSGRVQGFDTFKYYKMNRTLRSWICMPMTVGINERSEGTVKALYSKKLYKDTLLKTGSTRSTTWDRSLLFAMRGTFRAGYSDKGYEILKEYSRSRLIGAHVPYPFEAFPEGNRRHLSGESALYVRIIIEGMFGIHPRGFNSMSVTPSLPSELKRIRLKNLNGYNRNFDVEITNNTVEISYGDVTLTSNYVKGDTMIVDFDAKSIVKEMK